MDLMTEDMALDNDEAPGEAMPGQAYSPAMFLSQVSDPSVINFAGQLPEEERDEIARTVLEEYDIDADSMSDWRAAMQKGIDLAMLLKDNKAYPWDRAANVRFPLVTSAALQFNARAYPAVVPNGDVVLCRTYGKDQGGQKAARAARIAAHMSYQLSVQVEEWEEETDKLLVALPLAGTVFRKVWHDPVLSRPRVQLCDPGTVVVNAGVRNLHDCSRISEEMELYPAEVASRKKAGVFLDVELEEETETDGDTRDPARPLLFIEQHRRIDLDGDGIDEPYICTVHKASQKLVRIVSDFTPEDVQVTDAGEVLYIARRSHYVAYHFLPDPAGKFFGMGFGLLLGDISESIDTAINLLFNSAHMASLSAGFIGAEFRMKGGAQRFRPGEWKTVGVAGQDIRSAVVPLPASPPSPVMFELLGMLVEAGREIASVKDVMTGEANRQMTATTTLALIEQGQMLFSAAYKRVWRALKKEFRLLAAINAQTVSPEEYMRFHDEEADPRADYNLSDMDICPIADPRSVTNPQKMAKAGMLGEMAQAGIVDPVVAGQRMLEAAGIEDIEELAPKPDPWAVEMQRISGELEVMKALGEVDKLQAEATKLIADAEAVEAGPQLALYQTYITQRTAILKERLRALVGGGPQGMAGASGNGAGADASQIDALLAQAGGVGSGMGAGGAGQPGYMAGQGSGGPAY